MARPKKPKKIPWPGHTIHEMRAITLIHAAFGTVTRIPLETFNRPWRPIPGATWDRCPDCMTWFEGDVWPKCGWCGFRDVGRQGD